MHAFLGAIFLAVCMVSASPALASERYAIAAAHPLAAQAGERMLQQGGNALDAAIATQLVLNIVEPQSSGIGGGAFMLYYDAKQKKLHAYDGREVAPKAMPIDAFLDANGEPLPFMEAVKGGHSVGVPGLLAMFAKAHKDHGALEWRQLFSPAIKLAREGWPVSALTHQRLEWTQHPNNSPEFMATYFTPDGKPKPIGTNIGYEALADVLERVAVEGVDAFYTGEVAKSIVASVQQAQPAGRLQLSDMAAYEALERTPICMPYRAYQLCSIGPPSSGGLTVMQTLGMLEVYDLSRFKPFSADAIHLITQAQRLAYADRNRYVADPAFADVPVQRMLSKEYLRTRSNLINPHYDSGTVKSGELGGVYAPGEGGSEPPETTHFSIMDGQGNAVSMTSSIEHIFGSTLMAEGFLLNNQLTDFSFIAARNGVPVANRVAPGKRPRSSMSPMVVLDKQGNVKLLVGSPGGARIIGYVTQYLLAVLDWNIAPERAAEWPHFINMNSDTQLEDVPESRAIGAALQAKGHTVTYTRMPSGVHAVNVRQDGTLTGAADPRRDGVVIKR